VTAGLCLLASVAVTPRVEAASSNLTRAPYLTDLTTSSVRVSFGTSTAIVKVRARYGAVVNGSCSLTSTTTGSTGKQGYTVTYPTSSGTASATGNQWKVLISGLGSGKYCYRVEGTTSTTSTTYTDLLGATAASPTFSTAPGTSFAVIGDWGQTGTTAPYLNQAQANVIASLARSGVAFSVSTGDIGYPSGSQSNYGDLVHTGPNVSGVFGPSYWPVAGRSIPMYPVPGNHGFTSTFTTLWPSTSVAAASSGKAANGSHSVNGSNVTAPDYWFAYNVNGWRIYNLTAAWGSTFTTGTSAYAEDYKQHWAPGAPERTWLTNDLAANATKRKIAIFHYPLYSAVRTGDVQDTFLTAPTDQSESLEHLLARSNVKLVLNGHSHVYERNNPHNGLVSIISGGGGATLSPVDTGTAAKCAQVYPDTGQRVVAFARGWSSSGGSACNTTAPTSAAQVYHYLRVTLSSTTATVQAIDSTGAIFDTATVS
jgi:hypothetical protein